MTDVRLFQTDDDGNIEFADAYATTTDLKLDTGLETAVYLSWFGGNERDHGLLHDDANPEHPHASAWWGNIGAPISRNMVSETAHLLLDLPATSGNLLRVEESALRDVQWMLDEKIITAATVTAALIDVDRIRISALLIVDKEEFAVAFESSWGE